MQQSVRTNVVAVVLTFNRAERLAGVIAAIDAQSRRIDHILVVNNASSDSTHELATAAIEKAAASGTVVEARRNGGSAEGYYAALEWSQKQGFGWAWFVEDDLLPASDALERLLDDTRASQSDTVALASAVHDVEGTPLLVPRGCLRPRLLGTPCIPIPARDYGSDAVRLEYFGFLGSLVKIEAVHRSGLPRRDMLGWIDDVDFSSRLARTGSAWLVPASVVVHDDGTLADEFGAGIIDRIRRLRSEPPIETLWRNAYGLRNLLVWGRAFGIVQRRHAVAYVTLLVLRALAFARDHRVLRARIYLRMGLDGWSGRIRNASPESWSEIAGHRGSIASFLEEHRMTYDQPALAEKVTEVDAAPASTSRPEGR
ncbi:MAG: glycosyltransferase [Thermoleophilia bacterium]|nr:glycosyltransferase [Thermoleophilia bacterium]